MDSRMTAAADLVRTEECRGPGGEVHRIPAGPLRSALHSAALALAALPACDAGTHRETFPSGAVVVRHTDLPATHDTTARITEPAIDLTIGAAGGDDPNLLFGDIRGIQAASDGTVYVLDAQSSDIRAFDADGRYLRTVVRRGEGPGEITAANGILLSGDTLLWVNDHGRSVIIGVDPDGREVLRFNRLIRSWGYIWDGRFDSEGRYWNADPLAGVERVYPPPAGLTTFTSVRVYRSVDPSTGAADSVDLGEDLPHQQYTFEDSQGLWQYLVVEYQPSRMTAMIPSGGFWDAHSGEYRIWRTNEAGDTAVVIESGITGPPVTAEDRADYLDRWVEIHPDARRHVEHVASILPDAKPIIAGIFVDDEGVLWVERSVPDAAARFYDRFSEDGDYLGSVRPSFTSARGRVWIQHGAIYAWITDEMDVPYVVRAPIPATAR